MLVAAPVAAIVDAPKCISCPCGATLDKAAIADDAFNVLLAETDIDETAFMLLTPSLTICALLETELLAETALFASFTISPEASVAADALITALSFLTTTAPTDTPDDAETELAPSFMVNPLTEMDPVELIKETPASVKNPLAEVAEVATIAEAASSRSAVL